MKLDEDFIKIREYLYENDGAGVEEVSEETGVTKKTILFLLKEERLIVGDEGGNINGILNCESCRKPIHTGKLCKSCKNQVLSAIQESVGPVRRPKQIVKEDLVEEENIKGVAKLQLK